MCYSYFATPTSFLPRALRGRRPYAGGDSRATAAVGGLRQSPGAGRCKPPLPVGHGQRLCPRGRAVAVSLLDGVLWARPHRGAWLFAAFLGLAEATGGLPGRRGREAPTPQGRGPLAPALAAVLRALGPPNAAAPAWPPGLPAPPGTPPYCRWMQAGDGGGGRRGVRAGAAAFGGRGRPAGLPPACQTKERARGPWPRVRSFRALRAPPPPPRALGFCTAAPAGKAGREARAFCRPWNGGCRARA